MAKPIVASVLTITISISISVACGGEVISGADSGGPDASVDVASISDTGVDACSFADHRSSADRACKQPGDCATVLHVLSCCQGRMEGVLVSDVATYQSAEAAQACTCNVGCAAQTIDESGKASSRFTATCDNGLCTAHAL